MKRNAIVAAALALLLLGACKKQPATTTEATPGSTSSSSTTVVSTMSPEELGALGAEIKKHPAEAKRILAEHGLDEASFEKAIRRVSSNVEESRRYAAAYKKSS